jgi:hypothetical protein
MEHQSDGSDGFDGSEKAQVRFICQIRVIRVVSPSPRTQTNSLRYAVFEESGWRTSSVLNLLYRL